MRRAATSLLLGLAPRGGYRTTHIAARAGALLPHLFTLTHGANTAGNILLCGPLPSVTRAGCYPARCPPERGLSSGAPRAPATTPPTLASSLYYLFTHRIASLEISQPSPTSTAHTTSAPSGSSVPGPNWNTEPHGWYLVCTTSSNIT